MAHLKFRDTDGQSAALELGVDEVVVGRLPECDVVISKGFVSRRHARIFKDGGKWRVVEDGRSNSGLSARWNAMLAER